MATTGVCEAHLLQSYKPFVIGVIPSQTYGDVWGWSPTIHANGFVMALLQWHNVYKLGEDELSDPPVVALC